MKTITEIWQQRGLTIIGKSRIANALMGSLLVYGMQVFLTIDKNQDFQIKQIIQKFIWAGRKPKIRLKVLQGNKDQVGLRLFDPMVKDQALKVAWVKRLQTMNKCSQYLAYYALKPKIANQEFWCLNSNKEDVRFVCDGEGFWYDVAVAWAQYNFHPVDDIETILRQRICYNPHIRKDNKPFKQQPLQEKGLYEIQDLICYEKS